LENLRKIGEYAFEKGIKVLTIFCFSTENWGRSRAEVGYLMKLFERSLGEKNIGIYHKKGIRIKIIGQKERLPISLQKKIEKAENITKNNKNGVLNLAISYGGRADILQAVKKLFFEKISVSRITEDTINQYLWTAGTPNPDLIIRSGREKRLSNFLTWQSVYSELFFTKKYWPAFGVEDFDAALEEYSRRERRLGK